MMLLVNKVPAMVTASTDLLTVIALQGCCWSLCAQSQMCVKQAVEGDIDNVSKREAID